MKKILMLSLMLGSSVALADTTIPVNLVDAQGASEAIGTVTASESLYGVVFTPNLNSLTPGLHGFHLHENGSCEPATKDGKVVPAGKAGGHFDPKGAKAHGTPWGNGHLGDLPALYVDAQGNATHPVLAPRLKMEYLSGKAIVIHAGGDNYSDQPAKLGGGGSRVACGVIAK